MYELVRDRFDGKAVLCLFARIDCHVFVYHFIIQILTYLKNPSKNSSNVPEIPTYHWKTHQILQKLQLQLQKCDFSRYINQNVRLLQISQCDFGNRSFFAIVNILLGKFWGRGARNWKPRKLECHDCYIIVDLTLRDPRTSTCRFANTWWTFRQNPIDPLWVLIELCYTWLRVML